jgi:hypothetical protein
MCNVPVLKPATGCCEVPLTILKYPEKKFYRYDRTVSEHRKENCEIFSTRRAKVTVNVVHYQNDKEGEI